MLENIYTITEAEMDAMLKTSMVFGFFAGMLVGAFLILIFAFLVENARRKHFKMWLLELPSDKEREEITNLVNEISSAVSVLASKSNTRLFKSMHNSLARLKSFLSQRWMQE